MPKVIGDMTLYTVLELSKLLDVTEVTLRRYINEGKLKAKKIGGAYHVSEEALREYIEKGEPRKDSSQNKEETS
jgi:excisionase family DNA binding protein